MPEAGGVFRHGGSTSVTNTRRNSSGSSLCDANPRGWDSLINNLKQAYVRSLLRICLFHELYRAIFEELSRHASVLIHLNCHKEAYKRRLYVRVLSNVPTSIPSDGQLPNPTTIITTVNAQLHDDHENPNSSLRQTVLLFFQMTSYPTIVRTVWPSTKKYEAVGVSSMLTSPGRFTGATAHIRSVGSIVLHTSMQSTPRLYHNHLDTQAVGVSFVLTNSSRSMGIDCTCAFSWLHRLPYS